MTPYQQSQMRSLAKSIEKALCDISGERVGFFLCTAPFNTANGVADYVANVERNTSIKWLETTAKRFRDNESIPATKGTIQ